MAGKGVNVYASQADQEWLLLHNVRPRDVWRAGMAAMQDAAQLASPASRQDRASLAGAGSLTAPAVTKVGTAKRPPSETAREQCPHRNWGRYCSPCRRNIAQSGYPV